MIPPWLSCALNSHYFSLIIFLGAFGDAFLFSAPFVFGEIFFIAAGYALAHLSGYKIVLLVYTGVVLGDICSFFIGRRYAERILRRLTHKRPRFRLNSIRAARLIKNKGAMTLIIARISGPLSKIMPFMAVSLGMNFIPFLLADFLGVVLGSAQFILAGWALAKGLHGRF